ncbi:MAG: PKD domain-containing protein [Flavobacteriales bacterium]|nr:PKD domain-containing protein [Flavobacteriales bacterium]
MSNPFDDKIKQALEEFEMPYDANAWAELEKQLPQSGGAAPGGNQFNWKLAALFAAVATIATTIWYVNRPEKTDVAETTTETVVVETPEQNEVIESDDAIGVSGTHEERRTEAVTETHPSKEAAEKAVASDKSVLKDQKPVDVQNTSAQKDEKPAPVAEPTKDESPIKVVPSKTEQQNFVVDFKPSAVVVCAGSDVTFINSSSDKNAEMVWDFGDGETSTELNPVHNYVLSGNYTVTLSGSKGSKSADHSVTVTVNPAPTPMFSASRKLDGYVVIPLYSFGTGTQPGETAVWSFSDGSKSVGNATDHLFREGGKHKVELTVTNQYGCSTKIDESYTTYEDFDLLAPQAFTPNGDGNNETFIPVALSEMGIAFNLIIRNQTGHIVYQTSNANEPWDGTLNNGSQKADVGVYFWTVLLKENVVSKKDFNGTIHLSR